MESFLSAPFPFCALISILLHVELVSNILLIVQCFLMLTHIKGHSFYPLPDNALNLHHKRCLANTVLFCDESTLLCASHSASTSFITIEKYELKG